MASLSMYREEPDAHLLLSWLNDDLLHTELEDDFATVRRQVRDEQVIGLSGFGWISNYYRRIGDPAHPATERWWKRLRRRVQGVARKITMLGPLNEPRADVYAFPAALAAIQGGMARSSH